MNRLTTAIFAGMASLAGSFLDPLATMLAPRYRPISIGAHRGRASRRHTAAAPLKRAARRRRNVRARAAK